MMVGACGAYLQQRRRGRERESVGGREERERGAGKFLEAREAVGWLV